MIAFSSHRIQPRPYLDAPVSPPALGPLCVAALVALVVGGGLGMWGGGAVAEARPSRSSVQPPALVRSLFPKGFLSFLGLRRTQLCLEDHRQTALARCMQRRPAARPAGLSRREVCQHRSHRESWRRCRRFLQRAQRQYKADFPQATVGHEPFALQLAYLWLDYHQTLAGPPPLPPLRSFFLENARQRAQLQKFVKRYQAHLDHLAQSLAFLKVYHQLYLQLHQRSGSSQREQAGLKLQTRIWQLGLRNEMGHYRLAFLRESLASFADRTRQRAITKNIQKSLQRTNQRLEALQDKVSAVQKRVQRQERMSEQGQRKLQQLDRFQRQLQEQLKALKQRLHRKTGGTHRKQRIQRMYQELQKESRRQRRLSAKVTAVDSPQQVHQWQRCEVRALQRVDRRRRLAQGLLWGGVATLVVGLGGVGAGTYLMLDSNDPTRFRPAEASYQRNVGTAILTSGGGVAVAGAALLLSQFWVRPSRRERIRAALKCPPRQLFPSLSPTATVARRFSWLLWSKAPNSSAPLLPPLSVPHGAHVPASSTPPLPGKEVVWTP